MDRKKRILIIEDEDNISDFLAFRLSKSGFDVSIATNGEEGLNAVKTEPPDLIILDLFLPKLSGEEVCKAIREEGAEEIENVPIIMLTAKSSDADKIIGRMLGANAYMTKPFDPNELLREIDRVLAAA